MKDESTPGDFTPLQMLFLRRLERLLSVKSEPVRLRRARWAIKLVPLAICSTLQDCQALGIEEAAQCIMKRNRTESEKAGR